MEENKKLEQEFDLELTEDEIANVSGGTDWDNMTDDQVIATCFTEQAIEKIRRKIKNLKSLVIDSKIGLENYKYDLINYSCKTICAYDIKKVKTIWPKTYSKIVKLVNAELEKAGLH